MISSSFNDGRISCKFTRSIVADNLNEDRNLNESAYLLLAAGSPRGKWGKGNAVCVTNYSILLPKSL